MNPLLTTIALLAHPISWAADSIDEDSLIERALKDSPPILESRANRLQGALAAEKIDELFQWNLNFTIRSMQSDEKGLGGFEAIVEESRIFETVLTKRTILGASFELGSFSSTTGTNLLANSARTGLRASLSVDLYRDLFGRNTSARVANALLLEKRAGIEAAIARHRIVNDTRKLYWALVFNNESLKVLGDLLRQSQRQLDDAQKRFSSSLTGVDEVSRHRSLVLTRQNSIYELQNTRALLFKSLAEIIPSLGDGALRLADYDLAALEGTLAACLVQIRSFKSPPLEHTKYDELASLIDEGLIQGLRIHEAHDSVDIKLEGFAQRFGKHFERQESFDKLRSSPYDSYGIGLSLSIPLGTQRSKTETSLKAIENAQALSQSRTISAKIQSLHAQTLARIDLLEKVFDNQGKNVAYTRDILREARKKYNQARIGARDFILEQNLVLDALLDEIGTKLRAVDMSLDYLSVFTDMPCRFNRSPPR